MPASKRRILIMGAAGRDFHNFNVALRHRDDVQVVAFTATQIPSIANRLYPASLAGELYPNGIAIYPEEDLVRLIRELRIDEVIFAYSDVSHAYVMHRASQVMAAGADFRLMGSESTMLQASVPVVAVTAVRTGAGKSTTSRKVVQTLRSWGLRVGVVRHPMPYGDLDRQAVQRFASMQDLDAASCTIEEREEYESHLREGSTVYAGVDYGRVLELAQSESDVIVWDGGNNDLPFFRPDVHIVVLDPHRAGHEITYHPGETNLRMAHVAVLNKVDSAAPHKVEMVKRTLADVNPKALVIEAESAVFIDPPLVPGELLGQRVIVVEDGPTLTHGELGYGAAGLVALREGARLVDPRPYAVGAIRQALEAYPHIGHAVPAVGYTPQQVKDLEATLAGMPGEAVLLGTPCDLRALFSISKPVYRVSYELVERGGLTLEAALHLLLDGKLPYRVPA